MSKLGVMILEESKAIGSISKTAAEATRLLWHKKDEVIGSQEIVVNI